MSHTEQHATLERYLTAVRDQDASALGEIFSDDVRIEWPQSGERFTGKEACVRIFTSYPGGSPELVGEPRLTGSDDIWVVQASIRYPDGKIYMSVGIFEFENGKIAHEVDYFTEPFPVPEWRQGWADSD
jgi:ketosteroid isomerase-like protein